VRDEEGEAPETGAAPPEETAEAGAPEDQPGKDPLKVIAKAVPQLIAEVRELRTGIDELRDEVDELRTRPAPEAAPAPGAPDETLRAVVFPLHDLLFTRVTAMEAGQEEPDGASMNLLATLEGYLEGLEVAVIRPQPGEAFELAHMEAAGAAPRRFWRREGTVARVHHCGFTRGPAAEVVRKARVDVYR